MLESIHVNMPWKSHVAAQIFYDISQIFEEQGCYMEGEKAHTTRKKG